MCVLCVYVCMVLVKIRRSRSLQTDISISSGNFGFTVRVVVCNDATLKGTAATTEDSNLRMAATNQLKFPLVKHSLQDFSSMSNPRRSISVLFSAQWKCELSHQQESWPDPARAECKLKEAVDVFRMSHPLRDKTHELLQLNYRKQHGSFERHLMWNTQHAAWTATMYIYVCFRTMFGFSYKYPTHLLQEKRCKVLCNKKSYI